MHMQNIFISLVVYTHYPQLTISVGRWMKVAKLLSIVIIDVFLSVVTKGTHIFLACVGSLPNNAMSVECGKILPLSNIRANDEL